MNTVEALKELYKSFGGKLTDTYDTIADGIPVGNYSVIPDCFAALAEIVGGSIELPVVTQADAGDVLTVGEDGKWKNEEPAKELPAVTAADNGTLIQVINGAWAKGLKIKKKQVTASGGGTSMSFKVNSNNDDIGKIVVVGYNFTAESYALLPSGGATAALELQNTSGYGAYGISIGASLGGSTTFPAGTYTLDVYYIEQ